MAIFIARQREFGPIARPILAALLILAIGPLAWLINHSGAFQDLGDSETPETVGPVLVYQPPALYPDLGSGGVAGHARHNSPVETETQVPGGNSEAQVRLLPAPFSFDPPYPIFLPTYVDHDGALVSAASARVRQLGGAFTEPEMVALFRVTGWREGLIPEALSQTWCESRHSPYAWNGVDAGLFGMSMSEAATVRGSWFEYWGLDPELRFDPYTNALAARWTYEYAAGRYGDGWGPWSCKPLKE